VDWGGEEHALCLLDATGRLVGEWRVAHTAPAIHAVVQTILARTGATPATIAVGLETPRGALVDTFLEYGFPVFALNPKQLDRFRDRFSAGGAKDDRRDAHVTADALRTDLRAFRRVHPDDPQVIQLRELCRLLEELQAEEGRLVNRLREQLYRVNAPWLTLCPAADEPWLWTLLDGAPHPAAWPRLSRRRLTAVLRTHRIRRLTVDQLQTTLHQPTLRVAPGVVDAVATRLAALLPRLRLAHQQRVTAEHDIDGALATLVTAEPPEGERREHRDVQILRSLPGVGRMVAATMLTEAASPLAARDYATLRTYAGTAPVTRRSAKRTFSVHMRYACKTRLRNALHHWARTSIQHDGPARAYYDALRARGHQHARALRSVADRWLRILVAMLTAGTLYDPSRLRRVATSA
jgi:transposase